MSVGKALSPAQGPSRCQLLRWGWCGQGLVLPPRVAVVNEHSRALQTESPAGPCHHSSIVTLKELALA